MARLSTPFEHGWAEAPWLTELLSQCRFPAPGTVVDCAVSGGPDSVALLVLATAWGCRPTAHYVDHRLRRDSAADGEFVVAVAAALGVDSLVHHAVVEDGPDLEGRARRARHDALPMGTFFGHTLDDQAETVLLALLRGTGPNGVAAMSTNQHPLLGLRRSETLMLCERLAIDPVDDPSNRDRRFRRNRVRHELLPLMEQIADRDVAPVIARFAALQRDERDAFGLLVPDVDPTDCEAIQGLAPAVGAVVLRGWFRGVTGGPYGPDAAATERMLAVANGTRPRADVTSGWQISRTGGRLRLDRATDR